MATVNVNSNWVVDGTLSANFAAATAGTDNYLVTDAGVIKYRTPAQVLSDIGGAASFTFGLDNQIPVMNSSGLDFEYDASFTYDAATNYLKLSSGFTANYGEFDIQFANPGGSIRFAGESTTFTGPYSLGRNNSLTAPTSYTYLTWANLSGTNLITVPAATGTIGLANGADNQIPVMNGTTAFDYSSGLTYNGSSLGITGTIVASSTVQGTRLISTIATGTAPLTISSTTLVSNLNADLWDGYDIPTGFAKTSNPYTIIATGEWDLPVGSSVFSQPTSVGGPGGTGYWFVTGRRDTAGGYSGIYTTYNTGDAWLGNGNLGTDNPTWHRIITDNNASTELTQFLRADVADSKTSGNLTFNDNIAAVLGTGGDMLMYHTGTNNRFQLNAGDLEIYDGGATTRFTFGRTTGDFTATGGVYSGWWSNATISSPDANTVFTLTGQPNYSIAVVSNTTGSTNWQSAFGQALVIKGATDGRDFAFWRSNSLDTTDMYVGGKATGNTWLWSKLISTDNATTELAGNFIRKDIADIKTSGDLVFNDSVNLSFGTSAGESDIYSNTLSTYWKLKNGDLYFTDNGTLRFTFARATGNFTATGQGLFGANAGVLLYDDAGTSYLRAINNHLQLRTERDADDIYFTTGTTPTTRMFVQGDTGNVGIGTTAPLYTLDVRNGSSRQAHFGTADGVMSVGGNNLGQFIIDGGRNSAGNYSTTHATQIMGLSGAIQFSTITGVTAGTAFAPTIKMKLNASGNLSIGNSNDIYNLDVTGDIRATDQIIADGGFLGQYGIFQRTQTQAYGATATLVQDQQTYDQVRVYNDSVTASDSFASIWFKYSGSSGNATGRMVLTNSLSGDGEFRWLLRDSAHTLYTEEKMVLTSDGNLGIGAVSPSEKLHVYNGSIYSTPVAYAGSQDGYALKMGAYNNTAFDMGIKVKATSGGSPYMSIRGSGGEDTISIYSNRYIGFNYSDATATAPYNYTFNSVGGALGTMTVALYAYDGTYNPRALIKHVTSASSHRVDFDSTYSSGSGFANWTFQNGKVSIGNTNSTYNLDVSGTSRFTSTLLSQGMIHADSGSAEKIRLQSADDLGDNYMSFYTNSGTRTAYIGHGETTSNNFLFFGQSNNPMDFYTNATHRIRINAGGNVSIGNTNDTYKLDVSGTGRFTDSLRLDNSSPQLQFYNGASNYGSVRGTSSGAVIYSADGTFGLRVYDVANYFNGIVLFKDAADTVELMRLHDSGNLSIGNTTNTYKLDVSGTGRFTSTLQIDQKLAIGIATGADPHLHVYRNSAVTASGIARLEQVGTGDSSLEFVAGSTWAIGIDNSDDDDFKISTTPDLASGTKVIIDRITGALTAVDGTRKIITDDATTTHTVTPSDHAVVRRFTGSSAITVTVDSGSLTNIGEVAEIDQYGTGTVTIAAGTATLRVNSNKTLVADGQYSRIAIQKMTSTEYRVFGELA